MDIEVTLLVKAVATVEILEIGPVVTGLTFVECQVTKLDTSDEAKG